MEEEGGVVSSQTIELVAAALNTATLEEIRQLIAEMDAYGNTPSHPTSAAITTGCGIRGLPIFEMDKEFFIGNDR